MSEFNLLSCSAKFTIISEQENQAESLVTPEQSLPQNIAQMLEDSSIEKIQIEHITSDNVEKIQINHESCYIYAWRDGEDNQENWLSISSDVMLPFDMPNIIGAPHILLPALRQENGNLTGNMVDVNEDNTFVFSKDLDPYVLYDPNDPESDQLQSLNILRTVPGPFPRPRGCANEDDIKCVPPMMLKTWPFIEI